MTDNVAFETVADLQKLIRGSSNSQSMALLNSVMVETIGMSMYNAVSTQHNAQMLNSAATTSTCAKILSVIGVKTESAPAGGDVSGLLSGNLPPDLKDHDPAEIHQALEKDVDEIESDIKDKKGEQGDPPAGTTQNNAPAAGQ